MSIMLQLPSKTIISLVGFHAGSVIINLLCMLSIGCCIAAALYGQILIAICTGLVCSWLIASFHFLVYSEINHIDEILENARSTHVSYQNAQASSQLFPLHIAAINKLVRELARERDKLMENISEISYSSEQMISSASQVATNVSSQSSATNSTAAAVHQMTLSLSEVTGKVQQVNSSAKNAATLAKQGFTRIDSLAKEFERVHSDVASTQDAMTVLGKNTEDVLRLTDSIQTIADQTNLLALNASIEAARAGEKGRGFAVVAEEVRSLAEESKTCANTIKASIKALNDQRSRVNANMQDLSAHAQSSFNEAISASSLLSDIQTEADSVQQQVMIVSANTEEQSTATNEIANSIKMVVETATKNAKIAEQTKEVAHYLKSITNDNKAQASAL